MSDKDEKYDLYTEKIVKNPWLKVKKVIKRIGATVGYAVLFGVVASLVMVLIYPNAQKFVNVGEETESHVIIPTDSHMSESQDDTSDLYTGSDDSAGELQSGLIGDVLTDTDLAESEVSGEIDTDDTSSETEDITVVLDDSEYIKRSDFDAMVKEKIDRAISSYTAGIDDYHAINDSLKSIMHNIDRTTVTVSTVLPSALEDGASAMVDFFGFIAAEDDDYYYILTQMEPVEEGCSIYVSYCDSSVSQAEFVMRDSGTNLAVLKGSKKDIAQDTHIGPKVAVLGNSYVTQQGDSVVMVGNLFGYDETYAIATIASTRNTYGGVDSNYRIFVTDIIANENDMGVLVNLSGEVVGIVVKDGNPSNVVRAFGISELKMLIGRLVNAQKIPYLGIKMQTVTAVMQSAYNMPKGIYVESVSQDSPAFFGGIQSGDIITALNGTEVTSFREFQSALFQSEPTAVFKVSRPGMDGYREIELGIELGNMGE